MNYELFIRDSDLGVTKEAMVMNRTFPGVLVSKEAMVMNRTFPRMTKEAMVMNHTFP